VPLSAFQGKLSCKLSRRADPCLPNIPSEPLINQLYLVPFRGESRITANQPLPRYPIHSDFRLLLVGARWGMALQCAYELHLVPSL
jgi:hypothetical protein